MLVTKQFFARQNILALATLGLIGLATPVAALPPLGDDDHVTQTLVSAAIGEAIRQNCGSISARMFRVLGKAKELERYALRKGYTETQIKAFLKSEKQRARIISLARAYLVENGVVENKEETYCSLGHAEIAKGTLTGYLLWSW